MTIRRTGRMRVYGTSAPEHKVRDLPTTAGCYSVATQGSAFPFPAAYEAYLRGVADIRAGRSRRFQNVEDLIAELKSE